MNKVKKAPYAIVGTGDVAVEKARALLERARSLTGERRPDFGQTYVELADRGQSLVKRIQRSKPAKRAAEGTKQATRQIKGAVTSVRKAVGIEEQKPKSTTRKAS